MAKDSHDRRALRLSWSDALSGTELYDGEQVGTFATDWHFHEGWQLVAVTSGERHYEFQSGSIVAQPGHLVLVPPGLVHRAHCSDAGNTSFRIATLPAIHLISGTAGTPIVWPAPKLFDSFISVFTALKSGDKHGLEAALPSLQAILPRRSAASSLSRSAPPAFVRRIRAFLLNSAEKPPSLSSLASLAGVSPYHLTHAFTKHIGLPPLAFHTRARLMRSRRMIADGNSLAEASLALNFSDQSHFGRLFKRVYGMTPGEYQQNLASV